MRQRQQRQRLGDFQIEVGQRLKELRGAVRADCEQAKQFNIRRRFVQEAREQVEEAVALGFVVGAEQFLSLIDGDDECRRPGFVIADAPLFKRLCCRRRHVPGEVSDRLCGIPGHQLRMDFAGTDRLTRARKMRRELAAETLWPRQNALSRTHNRKRRKVGVAS